MKTRPGTRSTRAFTLLEVMMVVAIVGLVVAMGVPSMLSEWHEAPLRKATNDLLEICNRARAYAILHNQKTTVTFHPLVKQVSVDIAADPALPSTRIGVGPVTSSTFGPSVAIADLSINLDDYGASEEARVFFFPNGTSDELRIVLISGGEQRVISLEPTTALVSAQSIQ